MNLSWFFTYPREIHHNEQPHRQQQEIFRIQRGRPRVKQVVVTQRYDLGKDVFDATPYIYRYYRSAEQAFAPQDGRAYQAGEVISDRPINTEPTSLTYGIGVGATLIDAELPFAVGGTYEPEYSPLLLTPPAFE